VTRIPADTGATQHIPLLAEPPSLNLEEERGKRALIRPSRLGLVRDWSANRSKIKPDRRAGWATALNPPRGIASGVAVFRKTGKTFSLSLSFSSVDDLETVSGLIALKILWRVFNDRAT